MPTDINTVVDQIAASLYEGILEPIQWSAGMQEVQAKLSCAAFHHLDISSVDRSARSIAVSLQGSEPPSEKLTEFERHYAPQDIRFPAMWAIQEGGAWWDHEHFSASVFHRAPIYSEFLASLGMRHTVCIPLRDGPTSRDFVGFMRHLDQKPFDTDEQALVRQLLPHMVRANKLRHRSVQVAARAALGTALLDTLPLALAVVDAERRLHYLNTAAQLALAGSGALTVRHGHLCAREPDVQNRLERYVAAACGHKGPPTAEALRTSSADPHAGAVAMTVQILPLQGSHPLAHEHRARPHALLVWNHWDAPQRTAHIALALGLTETEARLALSLAQGQSLKDFAAVQGCSWHTARTHAKNLLAKTGCHRQAELVQLVHSLTWG